ncbi:YjeF family C-terminal domain protein [Leptospira inadai serovar Lyme str. 10]|uniref:Bifunctional NAD(P)H-hydrate repair enzyme n=2 Tax=Leptospira inadai serovar Lyme TaxID=293084 RepID=V6HAM4_9LEPT|nr:bifunctional ADP-dependent NAD(P)H-hydrate dehydratase/NAD(P)H-hydrate epimerase [Leptospira inadai]EQA36277.1 YjeF family C-terminal domain protein [Leptospira inadai serovar Lyme str. 10]PNV76418.1 bifunctional ADP-dependent NAD(P)H-hydrate dehydratase/NAD(P)H-hydrate epimerase [Leptospira inadai serovar Lyme]
MKSEALFTDEESIELDKLSINEGGTPSQLLMGFAAVSIFQTWKTKFKKTGGALFLCGSGNNGGDGFALAHFLSAEGVPCRVFYKEGNLSEETLFYRNLCVSSGAKLYPLQEFHSQSWNDSEIVVDSLLGTGFSPPLSDELERVASEIRILKEKLGSDCFVLSIDMHSGFHPDAHAPFPIDGLAEIGSHKLTNLFHSDLEVEKTFHPIGFLRHKFSTNQRVWSKASRKELKKRMQRERGSHKYSNGSALFLGGSEGMAGAILSSTLSFHEMGGGISLVLTPSASTIQKMLKKESSLMVKLFASDQNPFLGSFAGKAKVFAIGPGLSPEDCPTSLLPEKVPVILDAGAILPYSVTKLGPNVLLTPHVGEWSRVTGKKYAGFLDAWQDAKEWAIERNCHILLKGSVSVLCTPKEGSFFWPYQEPKLAVMGTGDLLVGMLAFFLSRGHDMIEAVRLALSLFVSSAEMSDGYPSAGRIRKNIRKVISHG